MNLQRGAALFAAAALAAVLAMDGGAAYASAKPPGSPPAAPTNLKVTATTYDSVSLSWGRAGRRVAPYLYSRDHQPHPRRRINGQDPGYQHDQLRLGRSTGTTRSDLLLYRIRGEQQRPGLGRQQHGKHDDTCRPAAASPAGLRHRHDGLDPHADHQRQPAWRRLRGGIHPGGRQDSAGVSRELVPGPVRDRHASSGFPPEPRTASRLPPTTSTARTGEPPPSPRPP